MAPVRRRARPTPAAHRSCPRPSSRAHNVFYTFTKRGIITAYLHWSGSDYMDIEQLVARIKRSTQHRTLYHFTDESNFPSIAAKGLVSKETMRQERWWPDATGGNELSRILDTKRGIDPYVSLCMTRNHSMKYLAQREGRLPNPRYLKISPNVLKIPGTKIAFGIANSAGVEILPVAEAIDRLDIEVLYTETDWTNSEIQSRLQQAEKFEVLVPDTVPKKLIVGVC